MDSDNQQKIDQVNQDISQIEAEIKELNTISQERPLTAQEQAQLNDLSRRRVDQIFDRDRITGSSTFISDSELPPNPPDLVAFYIAFVNDTTKLEAGAVIRLPDEVFILGDDSIRSSIYIRECYPSLIKFIPDPKETQANRSQMVMANPKVGKTFFGYVLLFHLFRLGATVIYQSHQNQFRYLFSPALIAKGNRCNFQTFLKDSSTFYILDDQSSDLQVFAKKIILKSLDRDGLYDQLFQRRNGPIKYMPLWSWEEIEQYHALLYPGISEEEAIERFNKRGGMPHFIFEDHNDEEFDERVERAISKANLQKVLLGMNDPYVLAEAEDTACLLLLTADEDFNEDWEFVSKSISRRVFNKFYTDDPQSVLRFINGSYDNDPYSALLYRRWM